MKRTVLLILIATAALAKPPYQGRPLAEVLEELRRDGLEIVYSTSVVRPEMRVVFEPRATAGRSLLEEIISPHGLAIKDGPRGRLLIVRRNEPPSKPQADGTVQAQVPVLLDQIVVTPSQFSLYSAETDQGQFLTREDVERIPHLADDLFRALGRLPGAASGDISAKFNVRGGDADELLVMLDGLEIDEPFHLKDFQSLFSIVGSEAVGGVEFMPGGFPAQYGDRMSAVVDLTSASAPAESRTFAGISFLNTMLVSQGVFDRGEWLLAFRRGYVDLVLDLVQPDISIDPVYYDILGKAQWNLSGDHVLAANLLMARDDFTFDEDGETVVSKTGSESVWLNLRSWWAESLGSQSVAYTTSTNRSRRGGVDDFAIIALVNDRTSFRKSGLKQDWTAILTPRHLLKFGWDLRTVGASYDYQSESSVTDPFRRDLSEIPTRKSDIELDPEGNEAALYVADRIRLGRKWTAEVGLRWDRQSYVDGGADQVSPRLNLAWNPDQRTSLRAAWGEFYQSQGINEMDVADGQSEFAPAEKSRHLLISVHRVFAGLGTRLDLYQKRFTNLRPRYENLFDPLELFPEIEFDRVVVIPDRADARGAELLLERKGQGRLHWWMSYAWSKATDVIDGEEVPRAWNQEDAINLNVNWRPGALWNFNMVGTYHSGWPTTKIYGEIIGVEDGRYRIRPTLGPRNGDRFPPYHRVDLRATRSVPISRGSLRFFVEVYNVLNRQNLCCTGEFLFEVDPQTQTVRIENEPDEGVGWLPSFGIGWEF